MSPNAFPLRCLITIALALSASLARAQDVIVTDPQLPSHRSIADTPPAFLQPLELQNIDTLKNLETYAYGIVNQIVEETGGVSDKSVRFDPTHNLLRKVLPDDYKTLVLQPALREGTPVRGFTWCAVIYNPPKASAEAQNAAPRLEFVYPVEVYGAAEIFRGKTPVVWVNATIDKKGAIKGFALDPKYSYAEKIKPALKDSFKSWVFTPASDKGRPGEAAIQLPVVLRIYGDNAQPPTAKQLTPRPKSKATAAPSRRPNVYAPAETDNEVVKLPTYTVVGNRILPPSESWLYTTIPGMEVLSNASPRTTKKFMTDFKEFEAAINIVWPALTDLKFRMPTLFILCGKTGSYGAFRPLYTQEASNIVRRGSSFFVEDTERTAIVIDYAAMDFMSPIGAGYASAHVGLGPMSHVGVGTAPMAFGPSVYNDPYRRMYKEYTRFLIRRAGDGKPTPAWLEEGLVEIVHTIDFQKKYIEFAKIDDVRFASASKAYLMPLEDMMSDDPERRLKNMRWGTQCYAFTHMCLFGENKKYQKAFINYIERLQNGSVAESDFVECFGMDYKKMLMVLRGYLAHCYHHTMLITSKQKGVPVLPKTEPVVVREATQAEVGRIKGEVFRLGNKLLHSREEFIAAYLRGERDPALLASLGLLESQEKREARAVKFLEAAMKAGASRPRAYHALANIRFNREIGKLEPGALLDAAQTASIVEPLMIASKQPPPMADVYILLADVFLRSATPPTDEQLAILLGGVRAFPRNKSVVHAATVVFMKHGTPEQADALVTHGQKLASRPKKNQKATGSVVE